MIVGYYKAGIHGKEYTVSRCFDVYSRWRLSLLVGLYSRRFFWGATVYRCLPYFLLANSAWLEINILEYKSL